MVHETKAYLAERNGIQNPIRWRPKALKLFSKSIEPAPSSTKPRPIEVFDGS
jgi:hypothetical protein